VSTAAETAPFTSPQSLLTPESATTAVDAQSSVLSLQSSARSWPLMAFAGVGLLLYLGYVTFGLALGFSYLSVGVARLGVIPRGQGIDLSGTAPLMASIPIPFTERAPAINPLDLFPAWQGTDRINVVLLGMDQRPEERNAGVPTRTDTMMLLSIDPVNKSAAMISFPRDLWVQVPGLGEERINAAYRFGELRGGGGGGAAMVARTIEQNFGVPAPYYAAVDFNGFQDIVNTLGGIAIDVPRPVKDDEYPTEDYGLERVYFAPGPQVMDGASALKYARTRHADSDFSRMARQQQVMLAMRDRALRLNMLPRIPNLLDQGVRAVQTNLTPTELLGLAKLANEVDSSALGTLVVDGQLITPYRGVGGATLLLPKRDEIRRAIQRSFADPRLAREGGRIEVVSSPARAQVAQQVADRLAGEGLQVTRRTSTSALETETTAVAAFADKPRSLAVTLQTLGLAGDSVRDGEGDSAADIRVVLGPDFRLPT
jgi:LCP family protein required for cell wall assembly